MPTAIRDALYRQAFGPVRWVEACRRCARAASRTSSNAGRARCWPAWSSASTPKLCRRRVFDPATLRRSEGPCWHERRADIARPGRAGHRRLARHRRGDRAGAGARRAQGHRHRHHRGRRGQRSRAALGGARRLPGRVARTSTTAPAAEALVDAIVKEHGGLHVLVNNAGITRDMLADAHEGRRLGCGARHQPEGRVPPEPRGDARR